MNNLISIIIPVHNSELYIYNCVQSVLRQTYSDFEIILADDGSQDNSKNICEKMVKMDKRIFFHSYKHRGVSAARNAAIQTAKGSYIFFLDSDDMIHPLLLESLYFLINKTSAVLATTEYLNFKVENLFTRKYADAEYSCIECPPEDGEHRQKAEYYHKYSCIESQSAVDMLTLGLTHVFDGLGGVMVLRSAVQSLFFDETLIYGEDTKFIYQILLQKIKVVILHQKWYYYRKHESVTGKRRTIEACQSIYDCECYMRDNEFTSRRVMNASSMQDCILRNIFSWYTAAKKERNQNLCIYLKKTADNERKSDLYSLSTLTVKFKFITILYYFPVHMIIHIIFSFYKNIIQNLSALKYLKKG